MSEKKHSDYEMEKERVEYTVNYIEKTLEATDTYKSIYKGNIKQAMVELDYLDSSLSYINVLINTKFMEVAEKNYDSYKRVKNKPYFARLDFKRKGESKPAKIYIGKTSLMRAEDSEMLIVDWRAPISTIYYEGRLGENSYETESGKEEGELLLKRQFTIDKGKLKSMIDIDITTTDTFLQASLDANAESKLKDIASTIQGEQNKVIRAPINKPLIVQGVAGSGKTTIALHRIAYFIYTYEETFDPENFLILAPNNLFINYISEVLPELGVERIKQNTFVDFMSSLLDKNYKFVSSEEKFMSLIHNKKEESDFITWSSSFKGSMDFKNIIDRYVQEIELKFVPEMDFSINGEVLISKEEIKKMFLKDLKSHPLYKRINEIKKSFNNKVKLVKKNITKDLEDFYDKKIDNIRDEVNNTEERRKKITGLIEEREEKLKELNNEIKNSVKKFISNFPNKTLYDYYEELFTEENILKFSEETLYLENIKYLCIKSQQLLKEKSIELEDYAPLVYLKHKIFGFDKKVEINSVVIDEAQDFSLFEFYTLKEVLNTNMFTLLGDLSQGIHSYRAIKSWEEVLDNVFYREDSNYMTLVQSYRTTIEIMLLANEVIKKLNNKGIVLAKPVIRHGNLPEIKSFINDKDLISTLDNKIKEMKVEEYKSIAVICKTMDECTKLKKMLDIKGSIKSKILDENQLEYEAGVNIVPSYLAKGLEFDIVFIVNINEVYKEDELDIKLLYVAMTRTLHKLFVYHMDETIPLLDDISSDFYLKNI